MKQSFCSLSLIIIFLCFSLFPKNGFSQEKAVEVKTQEQAETKNQAPEKTENKNETEVASIIAKIDDFKEEKTRINQEIQNLDIRKQLNSDIESLTKNFAIFKSNFEQKRELSSWNYIKIDNYLVEFRGFEEKKENIKQTYLSFLKNSEKLSEEIKKEKEEFKLAYNDLKDDAIIKSSKSAIDDIKNFLDEKIKELENLQQLTSSDYEKQKEIFSGIDETRRILEEETRKFQTSLFSQNRPTFYQMDFWRQFKEDIPREIQNSLSSIFHIDVKWLQDDLKNYLWLLVIFIISYLSLHKLKTTYELKRPPFVFSSLITLTFAYFILNYPLPFGVLFGWIAASILLFYLVKTYNFPETTVRFNVLLFAIFAFIRSIEIIDFPLPIYRIVICALSLLIGLYLFLEYITMKKANPNSSFRKITLLLTSFLFFVCALAEFFGYHLLAIFLVHSLIKTAFVVFALQFLKKILVQFLYFTFQIPAISEIKIFSRNKNVIIHQISRLLLWVSILLSILIIPTIWRIYPTVSETAQSLFSIGFSIGDNRLTLKIILKVIFIIFISQLITFLICSILQDEVYPRKQIDRGVSNSINSLVRYALWTITALLVFFTLGLELKQIAIVAGALSVGIGFGLQNIVNNFISGIILLFERPVKVGDILDIKGEWGEVEKVGLRSTLIRTFSKTQLIIPNSDFITQTVTNLTLSDLDYRIKINIGIAYGSDTQQAKQCLEDIVKNSDHVAKKPEPLVLFTEFGDSSLNFTIYAWIKDVTQKASILSELLLTIDKKFRELEIEIPFPQRDLHLRSIDESIIHQITNHAKEELKKEAVPQKDEEPKKESI